MRYILLILIRIYQKFVSPILGPRCRFYPTCSAYAAEALEVHGLFKGLYLACTRILRCHPFSKGGYDPVPDTKQKGGSQDNAPKRRKFCSKE